MEKITLNQVEELYRFLQGQPPECVSIDQDQPRLSAREAFNVIWFLQEHMRVLPDHYERCENCSSLYDDWTGGDYIESTGLHYCSGCAPYFIDEEE